MANVRAQGRIRIPLALLVSRYFLYAIIGAVVAVGIPLGAAAWYMVTGAVLTADYGEAHWEKPQKRSATRPPSIPKASPRRTGMPASTRTARSFHMI